MVVLAVAVAGVVRFAFDDDDEAEVRPAAAAALSSTGAAPTAASSAVQEDFEQEALEVWTPERLQEALDNPEPLERVEIEDSNPPTGAQPGGEGDSTETAPPASSAGKGSEAACKQPPLEPAPAGLPYQRFCYPGKLGQPPSKQIGVLFFLVGAKHDRASSCTASVVNTADAQTGYSGNNSLLVTAGHCVGIAPGHKDGATVVKTFIPHDFVLFFPHNMIKPLRAKMQQFDRGRITVEAFGTWLTQNGWFAQVDGDKNVIGFVPPSYKAAGAWRLDFATVVVAPKNGKTVAQALGSLGYDFGGEGAGKQIAALGYPADPPFVGNQLFVCTGKSRTAGSQVAATNAELEIGCDMTGGSSGGPWFVDGDSGLRVVSVNSNGPRNAMVGPNLNMDHWGTYTCGREWGVAKPATGSLCTVEG